MAIVLSYLVTLVGFVAAMIGGGLARFAFYDVPNALDVLTSDFRGEPASRLPALVRGIWLVVPYALAIASIVVAKGREPKGRSEEVTSAMTSSVIRATLFVVVMELASVVVLYAVTGGPGDNGSDSARDGAWPRLARGVPLASGRAAQRPRLARGRGIAARLCGSV